MGSLPFLFSLAPIFGLLTFACVHVLLSRALPLPRPLAIFVSMMTGLGMVATLAWAFARSSGAPALASDRFGIAAAWGLTYLSFAYFYVFGFYNLGESARRIRLLIELYGAGERGMTLDELLTAYNARMIVEVRLERLLTGGQIVRRKDRYFVAHPHMLYGAKALVLLKRLYLGANSEFGDRAFKGGEHCDLRSGQ
nr:hypothetical protein [Nitrospirota bacterium]